MRSKHHFIKPAYALIVLLLLAVLAGCSLNTGRPSTSPAGNTPNATAEGGGVTSGMLTEAAATLYAPIQGTLTQQAASQAAQPLTPSPALEQPLPTSSAAPAQPTPAAPATATQPAQQPPTPIAPTAEQPYSPPPGEQPSQPPQQTFPATQSGVAYVNTPAPQATGVIQLTVPAGQPGFPPPVNYIPPFPASGYTVDSGQPITIAGVNLPSCGGSFTANFLIVNQSGSSFESLSVQLKDLSTGVSLASAMISDAPFMFDDRVCFPGGISRLESGYALFAGVSLAGGQLSKHSLQANLLFCTQNGLGGRCFPKSVEFVVP